MNEALLAEGGKGGWLCPRRKDPRLVAAAFPGPQDYGTPFPKLLFIPGWTKLVALLIMVVSVLCCTTVWKAALEEVGITTLVLLKFLSLPLVSVLFTYGHIWFALWMTFYPLAFFGIPGTQIPENPWGLGWQGIVPSKARKFSKTFITTMTTQLMSLDEMFARIDSESLFRALEDPLHDCITQVLEEVGEEMAPKLWQSLPDVVKLELLIRVNEELPETMRKLMDRMRSDLGIMFDIEEMVVRAASEDRAMLNHMFLTCGFQEVEFIRDTGAYMGLFFGIVQMIQQYCLPAGWLLPVFGVGVGLLTNWLALKMTFGPIHPHSFFGGRIVIQGCFLKRQEEVAPLYSKLFVQHLGCTRKLIPSAAVGRCSDNLCALISEEVSGAIDRCAGTIQPVIKKLGAKTSFTKVKQMATQKIIMKMPNVFLGAERYFDEALDLERTVTARVRAMPVADFEQLLHPIFQEDEWILILVGGLLGFVVGNVQWYALGT